MRRAIGIGLVVLAVLAVAGIAVGAYDAGVSAGISQGLAQAGKADQVVRVVGPGWRPGYGFGFFPFGIFLFPLLLLGIFLLVRGAFWRGRWGGPGWGGPGYGGRGPWGPGGAPFEEWHRRQHEQAGEPTGTAAPNASGERAGTGT